MSALTRNRTATSVPTAPPPTGRTPKAPRISASARPLRPAGRADPGLRLLRRHSDQFLTGENFSLIIQQVMVVGTLAIGQTLIILTAGIDLSCGAVMAFGSIVMTKLAVDSGLPPLARDRRWASSSAAAFGLRQRAAGARRSRCRRSSSRWARSTSRSR